MIIGTAGHIDHGKTALVRALTGVDTDRLPEEKRRGITIELGFAPLELEGVGTVGVVDVPGHEAFVRTMVAGATGIDLALLVVAADEGVMPQTREHVAILDLLGTRGGVVALTKCDLADEEWLELVRADVANAVAGTALASAPVVPTSVVSGAGIDALRRALSTAAKNIPARDDQDIFRLPVDRAFSVRGTGTVVTGTVWSGTVAPDASVTLHPLGRTVRVRGVQAHGHDVASAGPATRAAIALSGVEIADVPRGSWLVSDSSWSSSSTLRADVTLLAESLPPRPREWIRFHLGTADVGARVIAAGGPLIPGGARAVRLMLQEPVIARAGDRFVLRRASPATTVGGGTVVDPLPAHRRPRPWSIDHREAETRLHLILEEGGRHGVDQRLLPIRLGARASAVDTLVRSATGVATIGQKLFSTQSLEEVTKDVEQAVSRFHDQNPLEEGIALAELRAQVVGDEAVIDHALTHLVRASVLDLRGPLVARAGWRPTPDERQIALRQKLLTELQTAGAEPPSVSALALEHHSDVVPLLRMLEREGAVIAVEQDRYYTKEAVERLVTLLRDAMSKEREYSPTELRDVLGLSRKFLIPFLEFCDRQRITERRTTGRVLRGH
jgi:selenocysteine-specific elongation factor